MARVLWQCLDCRKVAPRGHTKICPFCGSLNATTKKRCKGIMHPPGGEEISLTRFGIRKSSWLEGRPVSTCRACRSASRRTSVPRDTYGPIIDVIKSHGYTQRWIAQQMGVTDDRISEWAMRKRKWMTRPFFIKLLKVHMQVTQKTHTRSS